MQLCSVTMLRSGGRRGELQSLQHYTAVLHSPAVLHAVVGCQDQARAAAGPGTFSASAELVVVVVSPSPLYGGDSLLTTHHHRHHKMLDAPCAANISLVKCEV